MVDINQLQKILLGLPKSDQLKIIESLLLSDNNTNCNQELVNSKASSKKRHTGKFTPLSLFSFLIFSFDFGLYQMLTTIRMITIILIIYTD